MKDFRKILIWDDDPSSNRSIETSVKSLGYAPQGFQNGDALVSFARSAECEISAVLIGASMSDRDTVEILRTLRASDWRLPVIVVAAPDSTRDVVVAIRNGATDYICTPIDHEELSGALDAAVANGCMQGRLTPNHDGPRDVFRSTNAVLRETEARLDQIGWSGVPVLIQGETGSGKEVLARKLHARSARSSKPFLKLNCAALPSELVESELFGYERGAFTGAFERKAGIFELADGGTILLDEIGDMDVRLQAKLLQVLQDQEFRRIGGKEAVKVNVRVIAATHRDLEKAIAENAFREDLYYRLNVILLQVPPLRERREDILSLAKYLVRRHVDHNGSVPAISEELRSAMLSYMWPGNVRELENYMRKLAVFGDPNAIARDLQAKMNRKPPGSVKAVNQPTTPEVRPEVREETPILERVTKVKQQAETDAILAVLNSTRWNRKQAATVLKVDYKSLLYRMKKLGIDRGPVAVSERSQTLRKAAGGD